MSRKAINISESIVWEDITPGGEIYEGGTSGAVRTGDWRSMKPQWDQEKCRQCLLCAPTCPDLSIPVDAEGKRGDFDFFFCKGCGICYKVCPFGAIEYGKNQREGGV